MTSTLLSASIHSYIATGRHYVIATDGACRGNPGPGGWGALLLSRDGDKTLQTKELFSGTADTTNNQMELMAAMEALQWLGTRRKPNFQVPAVIVSDSEYLVKGMTERINRWLGNGWRTSDGKPIKNCDLWEKLWMVSKQRHVSWQWVRGHADHRENQRAHDLAQAGLRSALTPAAA